MEIDESIHTMTEDDVRLIHTLALDHPRVLSAVCTVMGIYITTLHFTRGEDSWTVASPDGPTFTGTLVQVIAYVRGYAAAWIGGRDRYRALVDGTRRHMLDQLEKLR